MRNLKLSGVLAASAAALMIGASAAPALADDHSYDAIFHHEKDLPILAAEFGSQEKICANVPVNQDGWHFVTRGRDAKFAELTVTFEPGGTQVITDFGPPSDKHAYAASAAGAELVAVNGKLVGGDAATPFNLSHTCPATELGVEAPGDEPGEDAEEPAEDSEEPAGEEPEGVAGGTTPDGDTNEEVAGDDTELAETGSSAPVIALSASAAVLLGAGGYLALRRRNAAQQ
jgi:LPXTG-motif cell wall-anchored protein